MESRLSMGKGGSTGPPGTMKNCPACGDTLAPEKNFCPRDGFPLLKPADPRFCPRCHRIFERARRYCSHDGARLVDYLPVPPPAETTLTVGGVVIPRKAAEGAIRVEKTPMEEFLRALSPSTKAQWLKRFDRFEKGTFNLSWNWPSFFFGPLWYFLKGIWPSGLFYCLGSGVILFVFAPFWFEHFMLWYALSGSFFGVMGSHEYYRFCLKYLDNIPGARRARSIGRFCFWLLILSPVILFVIVMSVFGR